MKSEDGVYIDFRVFSEERRLLEEIRYLEGMLAIARLKKAHMMIDALIEEGIESGLELDEAIDRALAQVEEPDVSWILRGDPPPPRTE